jgi:hypothetical protein
MKWLRLFDDFSGSKYKIDDVIRCIQNDGFVYSMIVKELPNNNPKKALKPISVDDDGNITIELDGEMYQVDLKDVDKIDYNEE